MDDSIFGAKASTFIETNLSIESLVSKLNDINIILDIEVEEYEPYEKVGSGEGFGFEFWLKKSEGGYIIEFETQCSTQQVFDEKMYDLTPWFVHYLETMCEMKCYPSYPVHTMEENSS